MALNDIPAIREATGAFCRSILDSILPAVREAARFQGYAIAVHGSLKRDIDLIAIAWTEQARPADELVRVVQGAIGGILGNCLRIAEPSLKPHGRIAYILIHPGFADEIDLSVIPPSTQTKEVVEALIICAEQVTDDDGDIRGHAVDAISAGKKLIASLRPEASRSDRVTSEGE